ncbi:hypothetical protein P3T76_008866 [Phytophthora citrophthora]|uniref:Uncharacterized protein n=1 Tax=Phytophthora citrophthora TaxID=4793 RepID=A0AAD9GIP8_9STRA|nr:hypothetical protein P3T76_008866 [Phytophthora citrophthora]
MHCFPTGRFSPKSVDEAIAKEGGEYSVHQNLVQDAGKTRPHILENAEINLRFAVLIRIKSYH